MAKIKKNFKITIFLIILVLILSGCYYLGASKYSLGYISAGLNPIFKFFYSSSNSLAEWISLHLSCSKLAVVNESLRQDIVNLKLESIELALLKDENKSLRQELEFKSDSQSKHIIARSLGRNLNFEGNNIIINRGFAHGLYPGLAATVNQGVIIGKISRVNTNSSQIRLLNDSQSSLACYVANKESSLALGLIKGEHNINLSLEMIPKDIGLNPGDLVTTSGHEKNIPPGLLVGSVSQIDNKSSRIWQQAVVAPPVDYSQVRFITIIIPGD